MHAYDSSCKFLRVLINLGRMLASKLDKKTINMQRILTIVVFATITNITL